MSDRDALVYLYEMTQGHPSGWLKQLFWDSERRCGEWYGIEIDEGAHVYKIFLTNNRLIGHIPSSTRFSSLKNIHSIYLDSNIIDGPVPDSLGLLSSLQELNLSWNKFTGVIPETLYQLKELRVLRLDNNQLTGEISENMKEWTKLRHINVCNNGLSGIIPKIGHCLMDLGVCDYLPGNAFEGEVPLTAVEMKDWKPSRTTLKDDDEGGDNKGGRGRGGRGRGRGRGGSRR